MGDDAGDNLAGGRRMTNRQAAIQVVKVLRQNGFEALLAGGCVRDMLLRRRAKDYDVATDARPDEVAKLFRRTLQVGVKFGVVIVLIRGMHVEVATFRTEADYNDGRHPASVEFTNAAEDASRRDFTINGMYFDPIEEKVIDYVGGQADLEKKIIRTIGRPEDRFEEDHLRMLRAVRFSTQLDFAIEAATFAAICAHAHTITKMSGERIGRADFRGFCGPEGEIRRRRAWAVAKEDWFCVRAGGLLRRLRDGVRRREAASIEA